MSHFTRIKTKLRDAEALKKALADLGYAAAEEVSQARGFGGQTTQVEICVPMSGGYDFGFRRSGQEYEMVADFWGLKLDQKKFMADLSQRYAYHTVVDGAAKQGFTISGEEKQKDGTLKVVVQRWR